MDTDAYLKQAAAAQPYPLLFSTISGAHLYGFPSPDSDYDLRGVHVLPLTDVLGLMNKEETIEVSRREDGIDLDLVTHDVGRFFHLLLRPDGSVLEQLYSPLVVTTTPEHEELKAIAPGCHTRFHARHYLGFAASQWKLFEKENPRRVKPLLYVFRVLLTGLYMMQSGEVNANLLELNELYHLPYVPDLVARKNSGPEKASLPEGDFEFFQGEYTRLVRALEEAGENTFLPDVGSARPALNDLLIRVRLKMGQETR
ncbi:MAG TPA: nucleotidyltransferase domain-containing protein [Anaerolineaceae bacterium]|nr:nucleotidyltransferase domain-containing protein [Anaerolineaceae bacterium]HPN52111.1 nucleotidyltransferase domain-containing protein [Anaerolineaceae bacterium]